MLIFKMTSLLCSIPKSLEIMTLELYFFTSGASCGFASPCEAVPEMFTLLRALYSPDPNLCAQNWKRSATQGRPHV